MSLTCEPFISRRHKASTPDVANNSLRSIVVVNLVSSLGQMAEQQKGNEGHQSNPISDKPSPAASRLSAPHELAT